MMLELNPNFQNLTESYLFIETSRRTTSYVGRHPEARLLRLGIGDVTLPLPHCVTDAMKIAADELTDKRTFRGYPPESGYPFLREAISGEYARHGVSVSPAEVYISDGAKSDLGAMLDLFGDVPVCLTQPVYPAYLDAATLAGKRVTFVTATSENGFLPMPSSLPARPHLIYLCSPANPCGVAYDRAGLAAWVEFACTTGSVLVYDAAYAAFVADTEHPRSVYEIQGADTCAIEVGSFSKSAGFTGVRCGWSVFPAALSPGGQLLGRLWARRQGCRFNGVSYVTQRAAEAALSPTGLAAGERRLACYRENAAVLASALAAAGIAYAGGTHSPYLWCRCPRGMTSWECFDYLLEQLQLVVTPGVGFGTAGEGYFRISALGSYADCLAAAERLQAFC